jgi:hypothetical protein
VFVGGQIQAVRICVEHYVDTGFTPGRLVWQARTGALANPLRLAGVDPADDATTPPLFVSRSGEATACWEAGGTLLSALQGDPAGVSALVLVIRDDDAKKNLFVDTAQVVVEWVP